MKTITFLLLLISLNCIAQDRGVLRGDGNLTSNTASWKIWASIEIDGHAFLNDTCKNPILWVQLPVGYEITDSLHIVKYELRHCSRTNCKIVHLTKIKPDYKQLFEEANRAYNQKHKIQ